MEDSGNLNPLNSKPQGRCLTFFTPKKWIRTSSKSLFILKFKSTVLLSQNSYKIPKSPRSCVGEHASAWGSHWGGKHWRQRSSMEATCCHVWARASTKTRSSRVVYKKKFFVWCLAWISYSQSIFKTNELIPSARIIQVISFIFTHICNTQLVFVLFLLINFKLHLFENIKNRNSLILSLDVFLSNLKETSPSVRIKYPLKPCWGRDFRREKFDTASQLDWNNFKN